MAESYEEYLQKVEESTNTFLDRFTSVDERIDYLAGKIDTLAGLESSVIALQTELSKMGVIMPGRTRQIKVQETIPVLTGGRYVNPCPFDCVLTSIGFHFPPGCNGLVDVAAGYANEQCFPTSGYLSLDDCSPVFPTQETFDSGTQLWVEIVNTDNTNPHTITVTFMLQERISQ